MSDGMTMEQGVMFSTWNGHNKPANLVTLVFHCSYPLFHRHSVAHKYKLFYITSVTLAEELHYTTIKQCTKYKFHSQHIYIHNYQLTVGHCKVLRTSGSFGLFVILTDDNQLIRFTDTSLIVQS